jgi:hypothetical protein
MPIIELAMIICPVEETGRNSVIPSTMAIITACIMLMNYNNLKTAAVITYRALDKCAGLFKKMRWKTIA